VQDGVLQLSDKANDGGVRLVAPIDYSKIRGCSTISECRSRGCGRTASTCIYRRSEREFLFDASPDIFVKFMWGKSAKVIVQIAKLSKKEWKR
jgi:hypothetical protein